ncbi:ABC transporter permease [Aquibium microcysteis]|uniref:ABC transporter permease n=1 Tax=Aquibium microcysteis TaxID=675281 RepID=UPI00165CF6F7|nr:iron ABC transporter permease [Aquibium microcysteis]
MATEVLNGNASRFAARRMALFVFVALLALLVLLPLARLQWLAFSNGGQGYRDAFGTPAIWETILNTVGLAIGSTAVALVFGTLLAWWATQLSPRLQWLRVLPILPIVIPAVASVSGWAFLFSPRPGYLNALLRQLPWWSDLRFGPVDIYTLFWIVAITGFALSAFVYLFVSSGLRNINSELLEAARTSGASAFKAFFQVTLPLLRPVLVYGGGVALLLGLGQFTAPLLLGTNQGINVLTTQMYWATQSEPINHAAAAAIGSPLLVFGIIMVFAQKMLLGDQTRYVTHGGRAFRAAGKPSVLAAVGIFTYFVLTTLLPLVSLAILSLSPFWSANPKISNFTLENFRVAFGESVIVGAIINSVMTSLVAVAISLVIGFIVAVVTIRGRRYWLLRSVMDIIVALPLGVPAVIFGVGFLLAYSMPPLMLYGSRWLIIIVYVTLMLPFTTRMQLAGMLQLGSAYIEASRVCGASYLKTDLWITLPLMRSTLGGAAALMFVLLTHEFTASVLIRTPRNQVMGTVLFDYWQNGGYPLVAAIALIMTGVTAIGVVLAMLLGGRDALTRI